MEEFVYYIFVPNQQETWHKQQENLLTELG